MDRKTERAGKGPDPAVYDLSTPRIDRYLRAMRRNIRFPRYYKKALNW
jgi:hypothetical protein